MSAVTGDPASCSHLGGTLRQLATTLRVADRRRRGPDGLVHPADQGVTALPVRVRRRVDALGAATAVAASEVDRVGAALQSHAADLAEAVADGRRIEARATRAGLRVDDDGVVTTAWGVSGVADGAASAQQLAAREHLQAELDALASLVATRRRRLAATLRESQAVLAAHAGALRR
ncbi:hypothetical protein SAMN04489867_1848 [Pedococcus dokdonensis]|uniref:Uncharacterized protein n=1 Tax=Pedococcus dokdonensis TaxID=443156 RepID=A0A1H0R5B2_9MICO|nr:hypothetical protein [Pedococcus dokdonensis]SDP24694.1 hypothetical protein SAMN04489867_1848 [Pedococcus dokdonensis]